MLATGALALLTAACIKVPEAVPPPAHSEPRGAPLTPAPGVQGSPEEGRLLFHATGCGGCHTLKNVSSATGVAGPNLDNVVLRPTLAGEVIPMTFQTLSLFLIDPPRVDPGSSMPNVGLTADQARDIAAFLYSLPYNPAP